MIELVVYYQLKLSYESLTLDGQLISGSDGSGLASGRIRVL